MPRYNFAHHKVSSEFNLKSTDYVQSLIVLALPGLILSVVVLILGIIGMYLRNCVHWGRRSSKSSMDVKEDNISDTNSTAEFEFQKPKSYKSPFCLRMVKVLLFVIIIGTLVGVILGFTSNNEVSDEVNGFFSTIEQTTKDAKITIASVMIGLAGTTDNAKTIRKNMESIRNQVDLSYTAASNARRSETNLNMLREIIITMGYIIAIMACVWGVFSVVNAKSWSFMFLSYISLLAISIALLGLGLHMPLSAASSDLCVSLGDYIESGGVPTKWMKTWLNCEQDDSISEAVAYTNNEIDKMLAILNNFTEPYIHETYTKDNITKLSVPELRAVLPPDVALVFDYKFDANSVTVITSGSKLANIGSCKYVQDAVKGLRKSYCGEIIHLDTSLDILCDLF
eukprot:gene14996-17732_t